jgi:hypothetical protein
VAAAELALLDTQQPAKQEFPVELVEVDADLNTYKMSVPMQVNQEQTVLVAVAVADRHVMMALEVPLVIIKEQQEVAAVTVLYMSNTSQLSLLHRTHRVPLESLVQQRHLLQQI